MGITPSSGGVLLQTSNPQVLQTPGYNLVHWQLGLPDMDSQRQGAASQTQGGGPGQSPSRCYPAAHDQRSCSELQEVKTSSADISVEVVPVIPDDVQQECLKEIERLDFKGAKTWFEHKDQNMRKRNKDWDIRTDRKCVIAVVRINGWVLKEVHKHLKADKEIVMAAVKTTGHHVLKYVDKKNALWKDKDFVSEMIEVKGDVLSFASDELRDDDDMLFKAFINCGVDIPRSMRMKEMVLTAVKKDGMLLGCAPDKLRLDGDVVMQAVKKSEGLALRFALDRNQPELLQVAGVWDYEKHPRMAILSVQLCMDEEFTTYAIDFVRGIKDSDYLKQFNPYNPNLRSKANCNDEQNCRGKLKTCKPGERSCWRCEVRRGQEHCKGNGGFMIQFEEIEGLSQGQLIEFEMAQQVGLKVFRAFTDKDSFGNKGLKPLVSAVQEWIEGRRADMSLKEVWIGDGKPTDSFMTERTTRWQALRQGTSETANQQAQTENGDTRY